MERIVYRKTLDVHKNGVQFMLQGFETADKMSRRIEISLMASGDTIDLPLEQIKAIMYVTTPGATEPSINNCTIKDNTIIYDVLPITVAGITEMRLKLIETDVKGATSVLATPRFATEVSESDVDDESATQTPTFTALEDAIAQAQGVYASRLTSIELDADCVFRANYADGTVYESDVLKELFLKGDAELSKSYAKGGTGIRSGEDTDNSMYYSNVSKSASLNAEKMRDDADEVLTEVRKHGVYTAFYIDFEKGEVEYISPSYKFNINQETGELEPIGEAYKYEDAISHYVAKWIEDNGGDYNTLLNTVSTHESLINTHTGTLDEHSNTLDAYFSCIGTLDDNIKANSDYIDALEVLINTNTTNISRVENSIENLITDVNTNTSQIESLKTSKYKHTVCIYGNFIINEQIVKMAFNFTNYSSKSEPYATVEEALKTQPNATRHEINGLLEFPGWAADRLFAGCYMQGDGGKYWIFGYNLTNLSSTNGPYVTPVENNAPLNLLNHLSELKIIDEVSLI